MKRLINKSKTVLADSKGETLVESIVSILVFSILMTAVTVMISASLRITVTSVEDAANRQKSANAVILEEYGGVITTDLVLTDPASGIDVSVPVKMPVDATFTAFTPAEVSPP